MLASFMAKYTSPTIKADKILGFENESEFHFKFRKLLCVVS